MALEFPKKGKVKVSAKFKKVEVNFLSSQCECQRECAIGNHKLQGSEEKK